MTAPIDCPDCGGRLGPVDPADEELFRCVACGRELEIVGGGNP